MWRLPPASAPSPMVSVPTPHELAVGLSARRDRRRIEAAGVDHAVEEGLSGRDVDRVCIALQVDVTGDVTAKQVDDRRARRLGDIDRSRPVEGRSPIGRVASDDVARVVDDQRPAARSGGTVVHHADSVSVGWAAVGGDRLDVDRARVRDGRMADRHVLGAIRRRRRDRRRQGTCVEADAGGEGARVRMRRDDLARRAACRGVGHRRCRDAGAGSSRRHIQRAAIGDVRQQRSASHRRHRGGCAGWRGSNGGRRGVENDALRQSRTL